jgi:hypothetical protein
MIRMYLKKVLQSIEQKELQRREFSAPFPLKGKQ